MSAMQLTDGQIDIGIDIHGVHDGTDWNSCRMLVNGSPVADLNTLLGWINAGLLQARIEADVCYLNFRAAVPIPAGNYTIGFEVSGASSSADLAVHTDTSHMAASGGGSSSATTDACDTTDACETGDSATPSSSSTATGVTKVEVAGQDQGGGSVVLVIGIYGKPADMGSATLSVNGAPYLNASAMQQMAQAGMLTYQESGNNSIMQIALTFENIQSSSYTFQFCVDGICGSATWTPATNYNTTGYDTTGSGSTGYDTTGTGYDPYGTTGYNPYDTGYGTGGIDLTGGDSGYVNSSGNYVDPYGTEYTPTPTY